MRVLLGNGLTTEGSSDGFYIDITQPVFDTDVMNGQIYVDVTQGEFTPVKYQASSDTIKAYWYCFDDESLIKVILALLKILSYKPTLMYHSGNETLQQIMDNSVVIFCNPLSFK